MSSTSPWFFWAVLSAVFAAMTAIFAKLGIKGVDSDPATLVPVAIFAFTFLGERPSLREWLGIAMVAGGVLVLASK
jgi:uncharacterized membrane protein